MSERGSWMPTDEEICAAWMADVRLAFQEGTFQPVIQFTPGVHSRAMIRTAVELALAEQEAENAKLKEGLDRLVRIYNERTDEVDKVREERNEAEYEAVELRAENANLLAALLDLYNAHQNKKLEAAMRSTGRWTQIKGMVGDANDEAFRALGVEVDK